MNELVRTWHREMRKQGRSPGLERYLYSKSTRSHDLAEQKLIFAAVADNSGFALHDRINALVAQGWKMFETRDGGGTVAILPRLQGALPLAATLSRSDAVRHDRLHVTMSVLTVLWHLQLMRSDNPAIVETLRRIDHLARKTPADLIGSAFYHTGANIVRGQVMLFARRLAKAETSPADRSIQVSINVLRQGMSLAAADARRNAFIEFAAAANAVVAMDELRQRDAAEAMAALPDLIARHALRTKRGLSRLQPSVAAFIAYKGLQPPDEAL
jgi:hypothetical protein